MIVEFIGLPGSGKTTVACRAVEALRSTAPGALCLDDATALGPSDRAAGWARPRLWVSSLAFRVSALGVAPQRVITHVSRCDTALRAARSTRLVLLHEGSYHRACILLATAARSDGRTVDRLVRRLARPDALVYLRVPSAVAHARAHRRLADLGHSADAGEAESGAWVAWRGRYHAVADEVAAFVERTRPVLRLDAASADERALATQVGAWVASVAGRLNDAAPVGVARR